MRGREKKREKGRRGGCEKMMRGRELGGAAAAECYFRFRVFPIYICIFLSAGMVEPVRFGSIQSVSDFENQNRTEPERFCDF